MKCFLWSVHPFQFKVKQKKQIHPNYLVAAFGASTTKCTKAEQSSSCCLLDQSPFPWQRHGEPRRGREKTSVLLKGNNSMPHAADGKALPGVFPMARAHGEGSEKGSTQPFLARMWLRHLPMLTSGDATLRSQSRHKEPQSRGK